MASMSSVTTRGFGNGTFDGSASLVVTLGYGQLAPSNSPAFELIVYVQMPSSLSKSVQMRPSLSRHVQMPTGVEAHV